MSATVQIGDDEFENLVDAVALDTGEPFFTLDQTISIVERIVSSRLAAAWTEGYDRAMQGAHYVLNQRGYLERRGESDDWNPYLTAPAHRHDQETTAEEAEK